MSLSFLKYISNALLVSLCLTSVAFSQFVQTPQTDREKEELRAVWIATAFGLDWPKGSGVEEHQNSLRQIIQRSAEMGLNTVVFQVTARGDAHHRSERLPWAQRLTGTFGDDPGWDPLQFVIDESRKYGLEVHAWYNVFNIGLQVDTVSYRNSVPQHVFASNRDWVRLVGTDQIWLNPGIPEARQWAVDNVMEIVENYDIDAIHFDFIRYPQGGFPDDVQIRAQFNENNIPLTVDWRRDNVTQFNRDAYAAVQAVKPWVKVGSTPVGHYQTSGGWGALFAYSAVFQDGPRWLQEGVNDYIVPQIYWAFGQPFPDFDWVNKDYIGRDFGRHIYVGIGAYRQGGSDSQNIAAEMGRQIDSIRVAGHKGHMFFRYDNLYAFNPALGRVAPRVNYNGPALVPAMDWRMPDVPDSPTAVSPSRSGNVHTIQWTAPAFLAENGDDKLYFAVYRVQSGVEPDPDDVIASADNLIAITGEPTFSENLSVDNTYYYVVTALSRNWVESLPSAPIAAVTTTSVEEPANQVLAYRLDQNFPNPFNPSTNIRFELPENGHVTLTVYDMTGRTVAVLEDGFRASGVHTVQFNASNLASGMYVYRLTANSVQLTRKMMLIK